MIIPYHLSNTLSWWKSEIKAHWRDHIGSASALLAITNIVHRVGGKYASSAFMTASIVNYPSLMGRVKASCSIEPHITSQIAAIASIPVIYFLQTDFCARLFNYPARDSAQQFSGLQLVSTIVLVASSIFYASRPILQLTGTIASVFSSMCYIPSQLYTFSRNFFSGSGNFLESTHQNARGTRDNDKLQTAVEKAEEQLENLQRDLNARKDKILEQAQHRENLVQGLEDQVDSITMMFENMLSTSDSPPIYVLELDQFSQAIDLEKLDSTLNELTLEFEEISSIYGEQILLLPQLIEDIKDAKKKLKIVKNLSEKTLQEHKDLLDEISLLEKLIIQEENAQRGLLRQTEELIYIEHPTKESISSDVKILSCEILTNQNNSTQKAREESFNKSGISNSLKIHFTTLYKNILEKKDGLTNLEEVKNRICEALSRIEKNRQENSQLFDCLKKTTASSTSLSYINECPKDQIETTFTFLLKIVSFLTDVRKIESLDRARFWALSLKNQTGELESEKVELDSKIDSLRPLLKKLRMLLEERQKKTLDLQDLLKEGQEKALSKS